MKKLSILFIIFLSLYWLNYSYASTKNIANIKSITYSWHLWDNTLIEINWSNFNNCSEFKINTKNLKINDINNSKITYKYINNIDFNWNINFICNDEIISSNFSFPYISDYKIKNLSTNRDITLFWEWFEDTSSINFNDWKKIVINNVFNTYIEWNIPEIITSDDIYITKNWLKSNIISLDIIIPTITHITSKDWFNIWDKINIYWENLNSYSNSYIMFWDLKIINFNFDKISWNIDFIIPESSWKKTISIYSNWTKSNSIDINIINKDPYIDKVYIKGTNIIQNGSTKYVEQLVIKWKNFSNETTGYELYNNWKKISITKSNISEIIVDNFKLDLWNNYIYIKNSLNESNVFNKYNSYQKPYISYVKPNNIYWDLRNFYIWVWNFDIKNNEIYLNNSNIKIKSCLFWKCTVQINKSILEWEFSILFSNNLKTTPLKFNIKNEQIPIINDIIFYWDIVWWTKFKINWENFNDADIKYTNLVYENSNWRYDIERWWSTLEWKLVYNVYDNTLESTIDIKKYWFNTKLSFLWNTVKWTKINWIWYIDNILLEWEWLVFKPWNKVKIIWKWFHTDDIIIVWSDEVKFNFINKNEWYFIIPTNIKEWKHSVKIKNNIWILSNLYNLDIKDPSFISEVIVKSDIKTNTWFINKTTYSNDIIYWLSISNKVTDLFIDNLDFKFENFSKNIELGTFYLNVNWVNIEESTVNKNWILSFEDILIKKQDKSHTINIKKNSSFISTWNFEIKLENINFFLNWTNNEFSNINLSWIKSSFFNVANREKKTCYDSLSDNNNCEWIINLSDIKTVEQPKIKKTNNKLSNNLTKTTNISENNIVKDNILKKIDIILDDISNNNEKFNILKKLNFYKKLRSKTKRLIFNYNDHKLKKYLDYFYDEIDNKYKAIFDDYVLSKD